MRDNLSDSQNRPFGQQAADMSVLGCISWIARFWIFFLAPIILPAVALVSMLYYLLRLLEYHVLVKLAFAMSPIVFWMAIFFLHSDFSFTTHMYMPYSPEAHGRRSMLAVSIILNRWILLPILVFVIVPKASLSLGAFLAIGPFTAWPGSLISYYVSNTDHLKKTLLRVLATLVFNTNVVVMSQVRLWSLVASLAMSDLVAKIDFFHSAPIVVAAIRLVFFNFVRTGLRWGFLRLNRNEEKRAEIKRRASVRPEETAGNHGKGGKEGKEIEATELESAASNQPDPDDDHETVLKDEKADLMFFSAVILLFANYSVVGWHHFFRTQSFSEFLTATLLSGGFDVAWQAVQAYRVYLRKDSLAVRSNQVTDEFDSDLATKPPTRATSTVDLDDSQTAPVLAQSLKLSMLRAFPKRLSTIRFEAPQSYSHPHEASMLQIMPISRKPATEQYLGAHDRTQGRRTSQAVPFRSELLKLRKRCRRMAVAIRFDACTTIIALASAYAYVLIFISPQPAYNQCNNSLYMDSISVTSRFFLALGVHIAMYSALFLGLKLTSVIPISFSKTIWPNFIQGSICSAFFVVSVGSWSMAYERGLLFHRACGIDALVE
ncbi:hypothetical protein BC831DRAFT_466201 [Entophlyctis helioformis]|nr:hypothetical protein BC831DRAFT_466201 [Entophlyctis helioformis]